MIKNIIAIGFVYLMAVGGWMALGTTITYRTQTQDSQLREDVGQLWGTPLEQRAPRGSLSIGRQVEVEKVDPATKKKLIEKTTVTDHYDIPIVQNDIQLNLDLDQRQKGLLWYSTYRANFSGRYVFENTCGKDGTLTINFAFPAANGLYDDFKFEVDGKNVPFTRQQANLLAASIPTKSGAKHQLAINYVSQGIDRFVYRFGEGINEVRNFRLVAQTDFDGYDHSANTLSPTAKQRTEGGWELDWEYKNLISGNGIGVEMPQKINPGPMAARISFFAPVSLGFFFFLIFIISLLRGVQIHPMNYFFMAASFFAFHLLLAYLVDHVSIHAAFVICSAISIFLVVSYMRLVVDNRFAFLETALAQFVYLIGFSYAFFVEGFTGLAVAVGSIITLFVVMQLTAKINWSEKFLLSKEPELLEEPRS